MSWLEVIVLTVVLAANIHVGLWWRQREVRQLIAIHGKVDQGLGALAGRMEQVNDRVVKFEARLEVVEKELRIR